MSSRLILFFTVTFLVFSCNNNKKQLFEDKVHPSDSFCLKEIAEAKKNIKSNKLVYCNYVGNIVWQSVRAKAEMQSLLKQYGIEYRDESSPCLIQGNKKYHCYCELMQEKINKKFGDKFIDSLLFISDSLWVTKNRDQVFDCASKSSCWEKPVMFPGDSIYSESNHFGLQKEFEKLVNYPTDYRYKMGDNAMAMIKLHTNIDENGKAKVAATNFVFWDNRTKEADFNKKYWEYFNSVAIPLIEKTIWTPATIKSITIKSKNEIYIYLK